MEDYLDLSFEEDINIDDLNIHKREKLNLKEIYDELGILYLFTINSDNSSKLKDILLNINDLESLEENF